MELVPLAERFAQLALAAAYLAGGVTAILLWSRFPRPAMLVAIASGLMAAIELVYIATWSAPDEAFDDTDFFAILSCVDLFARLFAFGLLVAAAFIARPKRPRTFEDFDDDL